MNCRKIVNIDSSVYGHMQFTQTTQRQSYRTVTRVTFCCLNNITKLIKNMKTKTDCPSFNEVIRQNKLINVIITFLYLFILFDEIVTQI